MSPEEAIRLLSGGPGGIRDWNRRRESKDLWPDLIGVDLAGADLAGADLGGIHLRDARLCGSNLSGARLGGAALGEANLRGVALRGAYLQGADLGGAILAGADLRKADLRSAFLNEVELSGAKLGGANLANCICQKTVFGDLDLSKTLGLEEVSHHGPSTVGTDTLFRSRGTIPENFLRGCGLSPWEVLGAKAYGPEITPPELADLQCHVFDAWTKGRGMINGCFISYTGEDLKFVEKLRRRLLSEGVNVWLDRHNILAGPIQPQIWRAIQIHHVVILVLSDDSMRSDWVEHELDMTRAREKLEGRAILCPVALDDAWKSKAEARDGPGDPSQVLWRTLKDKVVVDFSRWKTAAFGDAFVKLLRGMKANY